MANNLTGNFDAVLLVRVKKINAILATLHQNGACEDASPTLLHSAITRVGGRGVHEIAAVETRGMARVQLSTPAISLPVGSISEVTLHVHARAQYTPNPGTLALPEPVHGQVRVTCSVAVKPLLGFGPAKKVLEVTLPSQDNKIQFDPAPGISLSQLEFGHLLRTIRNTVRSAFEPVNTEVPGGFPFRDFKGVGGGQVLALPLSLTPGVEPPPQAINTVNQNFVIHDFAVGISREFVDRQLQPTIDRLLEFKRSFENWWTTYHVSITSAEVEWETGFLRLIVRARARAARAPNYTVTVRQKLTLTLNSVSQKVALGASNADLSISLSGTGSSFLGFVKDRIRNAIIPERDAALPPAEDLINDKLSGEDGALTRINNGLKSVDDSARAQFSQIRISPDALILDGQIATKIRSAPLANFKATADGSGFTALESWIPGGRIDRFQWSWILQNSIAVWGQEVEARTETHSFILPRPSPPSQGFVLGDVCLRVEGVQVDPHGNEISVSGGGVCSVSPPDVAWKMPAGSDPMLIPIWEPKIPPDAILNEGIAAHVNVLSDRRPSGRIAANALVHFAGPRGTDRILTGLGEALGRARQKEAPFLAVVVLPEGAFGTRRREAEARLGSLAEDFWGRLLLTEDYAGAWTRSFGVAEGPATFLLNGQGDVAWKHSGALDGDALGKAVDEHFGSGRPPKFRPLRIAIPLCEWVPAILVTDDRGQSLALRKLRGHPVLLNFWQSWSAPCIRELKRLQSLQAAGGEAAPVIVAVNGGEHGDVLPEIRRRHGLDFALVQDPGRSIARQFGIECWPTTVSINAEGKIEGARFGTLPEDTGREGGEQAGDPRQEEKAK
jgi:peroxiredoxin